MKKRSFLIFLLLTLLTVGGISISSFILGETIKESNNEIYTAHNEHLQNIAEGIDVTLHNLLSGCESDLNFIVKSDEFLEAENDWFNNNSKIGFQNIIDKNVLIDANHISELIIFNDDEMLCTSSNNQIIQYQFANFKINETIQVCYDEYNNLFLALVIEHNNLYYGALFSPEFIYSNISTDIISSNHSICLYLNNYDVILDNSRKSLYTILNEEELSLNDFYKSLLYANHKHEIINSDTSKYDGYKENKRLYCIPKSLSRNKSFTVGISVINESIYIPVIDNLPIISVTIILIFACLITWIVFIILFMHQYYVFKINAKRLEFDLHNKEIQSQKIQDLQQRQRLESIGVMSSSIAHEFNNLLTPIMSYSLMCLDLINDNDTELGENLSIIYDSSIKAKDVIKRITSFSKKQNTIELSEISINDVLKDATELISSSIPKNIDFIFTEEMEMNYVYGNKIQLIQVFINIILNSIQSLQDKNGEINFSSISDNEKIYISVKDNGPGISDEVLKRIYEPFFTTKSNGTGLGLVIVKNIIENHNGNIDIQTNEQGTNFTITLPKYKK